MFEIIERGEIKVKGKGKMTTYLLIQNLNASEDKLMGGLALCLITKVSKTEKPRQEC